MTSISGSTSSNPASRSRSPATTSTRSASGPAGPPCRSKRPMPRKLTLAPTKITQISPTRNPPRSCACACGRFLQSNTATLRMPSTIPGSRSSATAPHAPWAERAWRAMRAGRRWCGHAPSVAVSTDWMVNTRATQRPIRSQTRLSSSRSTSRISSNDTLFSLVAGATTRREGSTRSAEQRNLA